MPFEPQYPIVVSGRKIGALKWSLYKARRLAAAEEVWLRRPSTEVKWIFGFLTFRLLLGREGVGGAKLWEFFGRSRCGLSACGQEKIPRRFYRPETEEEERELGKNLTTRFLVVCHVGVREQWGTPQ